MHPFSKCLVVLSGYLAVAALSQESFSNREFVGLVGGEEVARHLGEGYDALTGGRKSSCLGEGALTYWGEGINRVEDTVDLISSGEELAKKLQIQMNGGASGVARVFSGGASIATQIVRETGFSSQTFVGLARYRWTKSGKEINQALPPLRPEMEVLLDRNPEEFRRHCGDGFVRRVELGADLYLVIEAKQHVYTSHDHRDIKSAVSMGFSRLLGLSGASRMTQEQRRMLQNFSFSAKCYSLGGAPEVCGKHSLTLSDISSLHSRFPSQVKAAKLAMAESAREGQFLVALKEVHEPYGKPFHREREKYWDVFYDYRARLVKLQSWLLKESLIKRICASNKAIADLCYQKRRKIADNIEYCALQELWNDQDCSFSHNDDFHEILASGDAGEITFFEHIHLRGRSLTLDLNGLFNEENRIRPGVLYNVHENGLGPFSDRASSIVLKLNPGWKVLLYEHINGEGRGWPLNDSYPSGIDAPRWFNDRFSSFRIVQVW